MAGAASSGSHAVALSGNRAIDALRLVRDVAMACNQASTASEVLQLCVDRVCALMSWPVGHAYDRDRLDEDELVPNEIWHVEDAGRFAGVRQATGRTRYRSGTGLPGRVLRSGRPEWLEDLRSEPALRATIPEGAPVVSAFAFPVLVGNEVVAVLEFFSHVTSPPDEFVLEVMQQIGAILGRVVERERAVAALRDLSLSDDLTGLYNRRGFVMLASQMLRVAARQRTPATVFFADLDGLKRINDQLGHAMGDRAICEAAAVMRSSFRTSDVVARLGGDELVVFALNAAPEHADICIARVVDRLAARNALPDIPFVLALSFGTAFFDAAAPRDVETLLAEADRQMYAAKKSRRP